MRFLFLSLFLAFSLPALGRNDCSSPVCELERIKDGMYEGRFVVFYRDQNGNRIFSSEYIRTIDEALNYLEKLRVARLCN